MSLLGPFDVMVAKMVANRGFYTQKTAMNKKAKIENFLAKSVEYNNKKILVFVGIFYFFQQKSLKKQPFYFKN